VKGFIDFVYFFLPILLNKKYSSAVIFKINLIPIDFKNEMLLLYCGVTEEGACFLKKKN
jgi:hypothetical protein